MAEHRFASGTVALDVGDEWVEVDETFGAARRWVLRVEEGLTATSVAVVEVGHEHEAAAMVAGERTGLLQALTDAAVVEEAPLDLDEGLDAAHVVLAFRQGLYDFTTRVVAVKNPRQDVPGVLLIFTWMNTELPGAHQAIEAVLATVSGRG